MEAKPSRREFICPRVPGPATHRSSRPRRFGSRSSPERSIRQLAYELGIADQTLPNWVRQTEIDAGQREGFTTEEREGS